MQSRSSGRILVRDIVYIMPDSLCDSFRQAVKFLRVTPSLHHLCISDETLLHLGFP